jgi:radical SAM superfamily enzyme YgiQ (UPF0313 family)
MNEPAEFRPELRVPGRVLVVSCYESGHQPLAAATALGYLERAGVRPGAVDLSVESWDRLDTALAGGSVRLVAVSVPMHTALHIGVRAARRVRALAPDAHLCFFGLYAWLNADHLLEDVADSVLAGEAEPSLVQLAEALTEGRTPRTVPGLTLRGRPAAPQLKRLEDLLPSRSALPALDRYAKLMISGERRIAAAVETTRGCLHRCRHCPIPPVYGGRFFAVPRDVVLEDVRRVARSGVDHITFADPDFLNGPRHADAIVRAMHREFPGLTFDFTTKVEHILRHGPLLEEMSASGCLFIVTAVESLSDEVLAHLDKGHTRNDAFEALAILRSAGIAMRPSFVAFTPWTRMEDYLELIEWVERDELIDHVDAVQFSIRLLIPPGSSLIELEAMRPHLGPLDAAGFSYSWKHPDPRLDRLQLEIAAIAERAARTGEDARRTFERIRGFAHETADTPAGLRPTTMLPARRVAPPPRLTEPWFC